MGSRTTACQVEWQVVQCNGCLVELYEEDLKAVGGEACQVGRHGAAAQASHGGAATVKMPSYMSAVCIGWC